MWFNGLRGWQLGVGESVRVGWVWVVHHGAGPWGRAMGRWGWAGWIRVGFGRVGGLRRTWSIATGAEGFMAAGAAAAAAPVSVSAAAAEGTRSASARSAKGPHVPRGVGNDV